MTTGRMLAAAAALLAGLPAWAADGARLFKDTCGACHGQQGEGIPGFAPPLAGALAPHLASPEAARYLAQVVASGLSGRIRLADGQTFTGVMPPQAGIPDEKLAAILVHVATGLNAAPAGFAVTAADIGRARAAPMPASELRALRDAVLKGDAR